MENSSAKKARNLGSLLKMLKDKVFDFGFSLRRLGEEDPRRIAHGIKVGLAISLVSLFYSWQPLFSGFGVSAMWAVLTVVIVFEYSVGATLGKGINRMIGTLLGGSLGLLVYHLAYLTGHIGEPILLAISGFLVSSMMTFMRFYPSLKARYDYGLMIFILTFCLVLVSGYQESEVIKVAHQRLSTVAIGSCITMLVCICICPVWIGSELHDLISSNLDKLGSFLLEFGGEYFDVQSEGGIKGEHKDKSCFQKYKSVLGTKTTEEIMANLAAWEPRHGRFKFLHPWKQYLKIGASVRQCAYRLDSLNNYLDPNVDQGPSEIRLYIQDVCTNMSGELGRAMKELALGMKKMEKTSLAAITHINNAKSASEKLMFVLNTTDTASELLKYYNILDVLPAITVASLLLDVVSCVENIAEAVSQLDSLAGFKSSAGGTVATPSTPEEIYDEAVVEEGRNGGFEDNHTPFCGSEELNYVGIDIDGQQFDHQESLEKMSAPPENSDPKK